MPDVPEALTCQHTALIAPNSISSNTLNVIKKGLDVQTVNQTIFNQKSALKSRLEFYKQVIIIIIIFVITCPGCTPPLAQ